MNRLLSIVQQNEDLEELLTRERDSELLFHFSPMRKNLLEWFAFKPHSKVLELGGGCGTITELLCEKKLSVVSLEPDKELAEVNAYRNQPYIGNGLDIQNGWWDALSAGETFDYVVWVGADANEESLARIRKMLASEGTLLIAVENRYGLKYLAGAVSEHTGKRFDGVQGCSKQGIENLLRKTGFRNIQFYYPIPDYRLPSEIYSDAYLPQKGALREKTPNYDVNQVVLFDEVPAFDRICEDGLFPQFANSYLIVCG